MRINIAFLKSVTKLLVLLILFVMLFLISSFLYSARYWRDVYIYSHPNITITRIPTLSELNLTDYEIDYTTDITTTDVYDSTTDSYNSSDLIDEDFMPFDRLKREDYDAPKDSDVESDDYAIDYDYEQRSNKNESETATVRDVEVIKKMTGADHLEKSSNQTMQASCHGNATSLSALLHPWIAAIFVKNNTTQQFDYICDGAILTNRTILTAARCLKSGNETLDPGNVLTVLGKTSLQGAGDNERVYRIKTVNIHENFTNVGGDIQNDLAIINTEEEILFNENIQKACVAENDMKSTVVDAVTFGWKVSGELTTVHFDTASYGDCGDMKTSNNLTFCATYGNDVTTCPSYGGLIIVKLQDRWYLSGIRSGDTTDRQICIQKTLLYIDVQKYAKWIMNQ